MRAILCLFLLLSGCTGPGPAPPRPAAKSASPPAKTKTEEPKPAAAPPPSQAPLLGTNEKPAEPAPALPPEKAPVDPLTWRPGWWIAAPTRNAGIVSAAAFGDAASVLDARRAAVDSGRAALKAEVGAEPPRLTIARYTSLRLPDGAYRAFVLVTSP